MTNDSATPIKTYDLNGRIAKNLKDELKSRLEDLLDNEELINQKELPKLIEETRQKLEVVEQFLVFIEDAIFEKIRIELGTIAGPPYSHFTFESSH